jgi:steroid delta-isomerase-like uncharacterized protein
MSATERNKVIVRRIPEQIFSRGDLAVADEVLAEEYVEHALFGTRPVPGVPAGREGFKQLVAKLRAAFPDLRYTVEEMVAEGEMVAARVTARGTHQGELMGIPPTGRQVVVTGIHLCRIADGKLVEHWANQDDLGLLQQLGVIPIPDAIAAGTA